jgi:hypothetical protein
MATDGPVLLPLTPEAREAIQSDEVRIGKLPFRVGREARYGVVHGRLVSMERRHLVNEPSNELYIIDEGEFLNVSREHFLIEQGPDGEYVLTDRGSTCGTIVDDRGLRGSGEAARHVLKDGSVIRIGTPESPFLFRFVISASPTER